MDPIRGATSNRVKARSASGQNGSSPHGSLKTAPASSHTGYSGRNETLHCATLRDRAPAAIQELACSSVYGTEMAEVTLTAGQQVTVGVDGFNTNDAGPYTLTATFQ